jgi:hypothetical protein
MGTHDQKQWCYTSLNEEAPGSLFFDLEAPGSPLWRKKLRAREMDAPAAVGEPTRKSDRRRSAPDRLTADNPPPRKLRRGSGKQPAAHWDQDKPPPLWDSEGKAWLERNPKYRKGETIRKYVVVPPGGFPLITVVTRVKGRNGGGKHLQETCHATPPPLFLRFFRVRKNLRGI